MADTPTVGKIERIMKKTDDFKLTSSVTVGDVKRWVNIADDDAKNNLADFIEHRFTNRYLKHIDKNVNDSGFFKMAICCLTIETLESFKQGEPDTKGIGKRIFQDFFDSEQKFFPDFNSFSEDFYSSIRCGILHQAETTNGWRILRVGKIVDLNARSINAELFVEALNDTMDDYILKLRNQSMGAHIWKNALLKIKDICKNCEIH